MMGLLAVIPFLETLVERLIPDPAQRAQLQLDLARLADQENAREAQLLLAQSETNKAEASHSSLFVAGWRPFIGWGCGVAMIYNTLVAPMFDLGVADLSFLSTILLGMLGLSISRTYEKVQGVATGLAPVPKPEAPAPKKKGKWPWS
jgi:hypothetical protein